MPKQIFLNDSTQRNREDVNMNPFNSTRNPIFQTPAVTDNMVSLINEGHAKGERGLLLFGTAGTITECVEVPVGGENMLPSLLSKQSEVIVKQRVIQGQDFMGTFHNHPGKKEPIMPESLWPSDGDRKAYYTAFGRDELNPNSERDKLTLAKRWNIQANPLEIISGKQPNGKIMIAAHDMKYRGGTLYIAEPHSIVEIKVDQP